jgi:putative ABC transport system permease protein
MSTVAHPSARGGPKNGGVGARRAVIRWAGRMFRREWRQQILVVTLLTVAVAAAVGSITIVFNTSPADNAEFGSAHHLLRLDGTDPRKLATGVASAEKWFGTTEVIGHRSVRVPGGLETVDFRAQDPDGAYGHDCSHSAAAATRPEPVRRPSPTMSPSSSGSVSGRPWRSTVIGGRSSASSKTRAS